MPNFSEGRDAKTLDRLRDAASVPGVALADFSADPDHNRCVATLIGDAAGLEQAALQMAVVAVERIDLRKHNGEHPFIGALDVLPFVPLQDTTMADADGVAKTAGRRIARDLDVPVYYYAHSAVSADRESLPAFRKGGLPGLAGRMTGFPPDDGPSAPHPSAGVCVVGARDRLIAFNVNLASGDVRVARRIAASLRESGGGLPGVRALGLTMTSQGCTQVSVNITNPGAVTMADVYHLVCRLAERAGVGVAGSELIGCLSLADVQRSAPRGFGCEVRRGQILDTWFGP